SSLTRDRRGSTSSRTTGRSRAARPALLVRLGHEPNGRREPGERPAHGEADDRAAAVHGPRHDIRLLRCELGLARGTEKEPDGPKRSEQVLVLTGEAIKLMAEQHVSVRVGGSAEPLRALLRAHAI